MDNVCNLCSQQVTELYQVPGYTFLTCSKCSENVTKGIMPNFYQNSRPTMVPTTSSILTSQLTSAAVSAVLNEHQQMHQKKSTIAIASNQLASFEQALQSMEGEILVGEEGQCPVCQKIFNRKTSLLNHIRNHSADKKYVCNYCQKGFSQQANLRNHERIHTNDRPYVCVDCGKAFTQITNLNNHRRLHTGERPYVCIELNCGRSFAQVTNLNNHMKTHHKIQQYVCNQCPKRFTTVTQLNHHLATHSDERGYVCPQCPDKSFKQQSHLQQHMKIHGSNFGFSCPQPNCREKFVQASHLETHLKSHGDFGCSMCTSNFSDENLLKKHIQKHLDGRYLSCPAEGCNDGFTLKHQLTKHLQIHHPIEYQKHKESKQVPLSLLAITPNIDTKQKIKVEQIEQIQPIMEPTTFTQIPITIHNGTVAITIPATYQQQLATVQTITPDGIITNAIAPSTSDATKKVLSMSQLINNVAVASVSNEELERLNNINTFLNTFTVNSQNQIVAEVVSAAHVINQDRKVCQFCFNVFKTAQTLNRHIEKFHS